LSFRIAQIRKLPPRNIQLSADHQGLQRSFKTFRSNHSPNLQIQIVWSHLWHNHKSTAQDDDLTDEGFDLFKRDPTKLWN